MKNYYDVIVVGSGAAGFASAGFLCDCGVKDVAVVTENINYGTSRNAGSDKQTYYKLDMCSDGGDSVMKMARDLYSGGAMNGSDALIEASGSPRCFMRLVSLGVPFPSDRFGRFAGYKTDHDNTCRATSAGPLTSKYMTEALEKNVRCNETEILDGYSVIKLIVGDGVCRGVLCLAGNETVALYAKAVILCTGAPAGIYSRSVYPECQTGATGLAIEAGAELSNFQEWQYGIASVKFRWNLSGSYQQVVPTYYSVDENGEKHEFLIDGRDPCEMYSLVFLKGYQWPFDFNKTKGSSFVDMLVFGELNKGRRVFIDYRINPSGFDFEKLSEEAKNYLSAADSLAPTPVERLEKLNPKAIDLYACHGIDLYSEPLEISLCAQHNNGGIRTDMNSETTVKNLFAVGEAAGKFGVYRPGGCALNDTQVGALRAAEYISEKIAETEITETAAFIETPVCSENFTLYDLKNRYTRLMSDSAGVIRDYEKTAALFSELNKTDADFFKEVTVPDVSAFSDFYRFRLTIKAMISLCATVLSSIEHCGSRGGCICRKNGKTVAENTDFRKYLTVTSGTKVSYVPVDDIPDEHEVFEKLLKRK